MDRDCLVPRHHTYPATYERAIPKFLALDGGEDYAQLTPPFPLTEHV